MNKDIIEACLLLNLFRNSAQADTCNVRNANAWLQKLDIPVACNACTVKKRHALNTSVLTIKKKRRKTDFKNLLNPL